MCLVYIPFTSFMLTPLSSSQPMCVSTSPSACVCVCVCVCGDRNWMLKRGVSDKEVKAFDADEYLPGFVHIDVPSKS